MKKKERFLSPFPLREFHPLNYPILSTEMMIQSLRHLLHLLTLSATPLGASNIDNKIKKLVTRQKTEQ
ncbi:hypothetical protein [Tolypothrix sp. PCC 7910]|uniref:hypothetical protein n=1 Tax=Tolypothrix sp. PCC 7910 TaxID=2099387 RepID=UPI001431C7DD|nr:hypothetical protein [Tolypothrix sp. PCC 7910]